MAQWLTPADLAERWQISPRTIRGMLADGELPAMRIGGKLWRIRLDDVEAYECAAMKTEPDSTEDQPETSAHGGSTGSGESGPSSGMNGTTAPDTGDVISLAQRTRPKRKGLPRLDTPNSRGQREPR